MPIIKSAKKRVKVSQKATVRNAKTKRTLREAVKAFTAAIAGGKASEVEAAHKKANSAIDTAAKKNVLHKNKAARKKAQLSAAAKKAGVKSTGKSAPKKAVAKPAAKKVPAKKAAPAKKPAAKKPAKK
jgi:small subunit ribosomal protein S20